MIPIDLESDAFFMLVSDALRAGPGTPPWHDALARLRAGGIEHADEYRLLVLARECLESGKGYRSVRAGPGFTRRVMEAVESERLVGSRATLSPNKIAALSAAVMVVVAGLIGYFIYTSPDRPVSRQPGTTLLVDTRTVAGFSGNLPPDWLRVGSLPIAFVQSSMKAETGASPIGAGGGVAWSTAIDPDEPFAVVAVLRIGKLEPDLIAQIFISDDPTFDADNATTPHEFVWLLQANHAQVILPSGRVDARTELPSDLHGSVPIRVVIDHAQATIERDGQVMWTGEHQLDPMRSRHVGVRFLRASETAGDGVAFASVRVNMRQK